MAVALAMANTTERCATLVSADEATAVAIAAVAVTALVILGLLVVYTIANIIINALLIHAARKSKPGYTLPWLIINMIGIIGGALSIFSGNWIYIVDVPLTIYFWIVIKSYRDQLNAGTLATV